MKEVSGMNCAAERGVRATEGGVVETRAVDNKEARREENSWVLGCGRFHPSAKC